MSSFCYQEVEPASSSQQQQHQQALDNDTEEDYNY
jgi:hypothetical protein